jgi:hypothetical protein
MRTWRVGSISMGAALLLLGVFLLLSQLLKWDSAYVMTGWWPVLFIILGIEILVYLFFTNKENTTVKYDFISIFFVGIIGTVGIGLSILQMTGLTEKFNTWMSYEENTLEIPEYNEGLEDSIKRVVVKAGDSPLTVESSTSGEVSVFGTYRVSMAKGEVPLKEASDYLSSKKQGDTLYLTFKGLPHNSGNPFFRSNGELSPTIVVPSKVALEVDGGHQPVKMKPRTMKKSWTVTDGGEVSLQLPSSADVLLDAVNIEQLNGEEKGWNFIEKRAAQTEEVPPINSPEGMSTPISGTLKIGKATHTIHIANAYQLNVTIQ